MIEKIYIDISIHGWKHEPVKKDVVLFESFHGKDISDSPLAMMQELLKEGKYKIYFTTNNYEVHKKFVKRK